MYRIFNGNLLYHGCVPLDESGNLEGVAFGKKRYHGREYLDYAERIARRAWSKDARQKTVILCGISGVEENPLFPEEILRHLSGLMYWMKIRGLNNQIHIINSIMRRKSAI